MKNSITGQTLVKATERKKHNWGGQKQCHLYQSLSFQYIKSSGQLPNNHVSKPEAPSQASVPSLLLFVILRLMLTSDSW